MKSLFKAVSVICFVSILTLNPAQASSSSLSSAIAAAMFAQPTDGPLSAEKAKLVIQALQAELAKKYLVCTSPNYPDSTDLSQGVSNFLVEDNVVVAISSDHSQPVLTVTKALGTPVNSVVTASITTSADFKKIASIHIVREAIAIHSVNVGDLIHPVFEDRATHTIELELNCNPQN